MKTVHLSAALLCASLAGCASHYSGQHLVPGRSTATEVEASMGRPAASISAGGENVWFYPRQPWGRQTYAVRLGPDNIVRGVEQRLTQENIGKIQAEKHTTQDVRALFGPPYSVSRIPFKQHDAWEYKMNPGLKSDWMILVVQFTDDGVVREVHYMDDPAKNYENVDADGGEDWQ